MSRAKWFDCNGVELFEGDTVREIHSGDEELVYECHPPYDAEALSLGLNASNESFLRLHPERPREIYPFSNFSHKVVNGQRWLDDYEKVV